MIRHNPLIAEKTTWRFSVDNYIQLHQNGIISEDARVELLDGEIIEMSPIGYRHAYLVTRLRELFIKTLGFKHAIYEQNPVKLSESSMPQPDLLVLRQPSSGYADSLPTPAEVLILVEVSDSLVQYDRQEKLPIYAAADITEFWLVDAEQQTIEQYTAPLAERYANLVIHQLHQTIGSVNLPELKITLTEIFETA
jgi:Uma2 family endonuclease